MLTDKTMLRRKLEGVVADLRHAYSFLSQGTLVTEGQQNVAGLVARQIRTIEDVLEHEDGMPREPWKYFVCPFTCGYYTGCTGDGDVAARTAVTGHLQRGRHRLSRPEAKRLALALFATVGKPSDDAVARSVENTTDGPRAPASSPKPSLGDF